MCGVPCVWAVVPGRMQRIEARVTLLCGCSAADDNIIITMSCHSTEPCQNDAQRLLRRKGMFEGQIAWPPWGVSHTRIMCGRATAALFLFALTVLQHMPDGLMQLKKLNPKYNFSEGLTRKTVWCSGSHIICRCWYYEDLLSAVGWNFSMWVYSHSDTLVCAGERQPLLKITLVAWDAYTMYRRNRSTLQYNNIIIILLHTLTNC